MNIFLSTHKPLQFLHILERQMCPKTVYQCHNYTVIIAQSIVLPDFSGWRAFLTLTFIGFIYYNLINS